MLTSNSDVHEARFTFETITSKCIGHIRLINGKCKTLLTLTNSLKDYEENKGYKRELGTEFGFFKDRKNWLENRNIEVDYILKENEGHGFHNEENQFDFYKAMGDFLNKHLK